MIKIGVEYEFIDYMIKHWNEYFDSYIIATEVSFKGALKAVDAVGHDGVKYILIEYKREKISEEDFYNLKQIIDNNKYHEPMRGLLIGTDISIRVLKKIELEKDIDYFILEDVVYDKNIKNQGKKKKYNIERDGIYKKIFKFFACSVGHDNIKLINRKDYPVLRYKLRNGYEVDIALFNDCCNIEIFKKIGMLYDRWNKVIDYQEVSYYKIDEIIFNIENEYYISELIKRNDNFKKNSKYFSSLGLISKYINLREICFTNYFQNNSITIYSGNGISFIPNITNNRYYICPLRFKNIMLKKIKDKKMYNTYLYNYITILECTRLILEKKVYKPLIKVSYKDSYIMADFIIELNNGKTIHRLYQINMLHKIKNLEFYLIANIDIILSFEKYVKEHIKGKITIDSKYGDFIATDKYNEYRDKYTEIETIRDIIKNIADEDIK